MLNTKMYIFPSLVAEMARHGDTLSNLSAEMGKANIKIGYQALSARLRGKKSFELPEIAFLMQRYNKDFQYLFEKNVSTLSNQPQQSA